MLTRVVGMHWHALVRDLLSLGYRRQDMFTTLDLADMVSIVVGAPPTSAVRHFLDGGWSREAQLLANWQEQQAGLANLEEPYQRPGINERPIPEGQVFRGQTYDWDEFTALEQERYAAAAEGRLPVGTNRVRTI